MPLHRRLYLIPGSKKSRIVHSSGSVFTENTTVVLWHNGNVVALDVKIVGLRVKVGYTK